MSLLNAFYKDWPVQDQRKLNDSMPGMYMEIGGEMNGTGNWREIVADLSESFHNPPRGEGQSFAELLKEWGNDVMCLGIDL